MFVIDPVTIRVIKKFPHRAKDIAQSFDAKQIASKEWLLQELKKIDIPNLNYITIAGGWFGNILVPRLKLQYPEIAIRIHEIDEEAIKIGQTFFKNQDNVKFYYQNSDDYLYKTLTINCSCEHMRPINIRPESYVALQSNNYFSVKDHINCVNSVEELASQHQLKNVMFWGEMDFGIYKRFMVIGRK